MQIVVDEDESLARLFELLAVRFVLGYPSRGGLFAPDKTRSFNQRRMSPGGA
jgi:hypothetical protein